MRKSIMVDIETMGNRSSSAITSIAAVEFNDKGDTVSTFYELVDLQSSLDLGLTVDGSTIMWWLQQSEEARVEVTKPGKNLKEVLYLFRKYLEEVGTEETDIWANSPSFDLVIIDNAYKAIGQRKPWSYGGERDVRTVFRLAGLDKNSVPFEGTVHNAVDDCKHQIKMVLKALEILNGKDKTNNSSGKDIGSSQGEILLSGTAKTGHSAVNTAGAQ